MPKARAEKIVSDDGTTKVIEIEVGQPDKTTKPARYEVPSTSAKFQEMVLGASDTPGKDADGKPTESVLAWLYRMHCTAVDRAARASVYEAAQAESTKITVGKDRFDIMDFPVDRFVRAYNGMLATVDTKAMLLGDSDEAREAAEKSQGFGPWRVAARKFAENGKVRVTDGGQVEIAS